MALVLTRRPGEAIILRRRGVDGVMRTMRLYVVSIEGNVVRLSIDAIPEVQIIREELLEEPAKVGAVQLGAAVLGLLAG